ncbi:hypothetical protein [Sphingopyxis macrogoltabida]|uniref:Uncharacterized protein n=1 Tax=Sphingopyxis macrogoltabida TaxID=33050 RepID=A0AAC9AZ13_SPHMC|nr:hypothetical protein [Sphingopyxis macrogoltabida]ALJ16254.1 hypothetical protein LH19_25535 [Sphingopyxis macrogoltabida]AMU92493.1 hypothetical protein ATM17_26100 [Sphingopyxis macrogoltabida]
MRADTLSSPASWNRFAGISRPVAVLLLALLAGLMLLGALRSHAPVPPDLSEPRLVKAEGMIGDHALYLKTLRAMEHGDPYYAAVVAVHREASYPLRPFVAVRLPTLAVATAAIGLPAMTLLASLLGLAVILAWRRRLMNEAGLPAYARFAALPIALSVGQVASGQWVLIHETLAGVLVALALALYRPARPWAAMAVIALALAIRETVLPVAMLLGLFALIDRDWRAAAAWVGVGIALAVALAFHAAAVAAATNAADVASPGWFGLGGWSNYIAFIHQTSVLRFFAPPWVAAILAPLALLGWAAWRSRLGTIGLGVQLIYAALFALFARPDNDYWGMLVVPTLFIGLIFAPAALAALGRALASPLPPGGRLVTEDLP